MTEFKQRLDTLIMMLTDPCILVEERLEGWEIGYKDAIEKACEWLKDNHADIFIRYIRGYDADDEMELLKKYMEDETN